MLLKGSDLGVRRWIVGRGRTGFRSQEKDFENAPPSPATVPNCDASLHSNSVGNRERKELVISKRDERSGNVYENKGSMV
jgi:hypothetical protein